MRMRIVSNALMAMAAIFLLWAVAQQEQQMDTVTVSESSQYGPYLTDFEGRTLYLLVDDAESVRGMENEPMTEGIRSEAASCTGDCVEKWPPLFSEIPDQGISAGDEVNGELLYVAEVDDREQVVYNGWPLYYFVEDQGSGEINGQGVGGQAFIVSAEGWMIEEGVAGGGQAEDQPSGEEAEGANGAAAEPGDADTDGEEGPAEDAGVGEGAADEEAAGEEAAGEGATDEGAAGDGAADEGAADDGAGEGSY